MKRSILPGLIGICLFSACATHQPQPVPSAKDSAAAPDSGKTPFFPVADYLRSDILRVDSMPVAYLRHTTIHGHTDSAFINVHELNALAVQFVPPVLGDSGFEKKFTESSFADKTTGSVTFTYSTEDNTQTLRRVDVVTVPGNGANQVKSVYLELSWSGGDSSVFQRLLWKGQEGLQIVTMRRKNGKDAGEQLTSVVWGKEQ